jgi:predicted nuclease of predicted toxin-antitoxin system
MKLLFDQNISHRTLALLKEHLPDSRQVRDVNLQFASDKQIWAYAKENAYQIVSFDADFYDLVTLYGHPPKLIWLRLGNKSSIELANELIRNMISIKNFLLSVNQDIACLEIHKIEFNCNFSH